MKTILCVVITFFLGTSFATIHTVSNRPNTDPDFTTLNAAHNAAQPGDTLYVCGSPTGYGDFSMSKQLTLIGPGFFLEENPQTQVSVFTAIIDHLTFNTGSGGSLITGMQLTRITCNTSNLTLMRNYIRSTESPSDYIINIGYSHTNVSVLQNYMYYNAEYASSVGLIESGSNSHGILIANNIMISLEQKNIYIAPNSSASIENNVIQGGSVTISNTVFQNNIQVSGSFTAGTGNQIQHNLGNSDQFGTENGNQSNVDMNTVFAYSGSTDGQYALLPASPAVGAGLGGVDCGAYGGDGPYVLSGMPANVPSIYELSAPSSGFSLPLRFKARTH
jgi:hypothetical protein